MRRMTSALIGLGLAGGLAAPAAAQDGFVACTTQQEIEQYLDSGGELMPDGCRVVGATVLEADGRRLCALDIGAAQEGIVGAIQDAAVPSQWWAECDSVAAHLQ